MGNQKSSIFRAYDIRGIYPSEISEDIAFRIGAAFGTFNPGKIVVGCDTRLSSPQLKESFTKGLISTGTSSQPSKVLDIGVVPTPVVVFVIKRFGCDGGVNITASHNQKEYNGFKFFDGDAMPISYESGIGKIKEIFENNRYKYKGEGKGTYSRNNIKSDYIGFLLSKVNIENPRLTVVIDASNGATGIYAPSIYRSLGVSVHELNCTPDGNFRHEPDPSKEENLIDAKKKVCEVGADIGFVYDGDGDRLAVIDEEGNVIESSRIFCLLIQHLLKEKRKMKIVYDVLTSKMVEDTIKKFYGIPIESRVGHTYITQRLMGEDAALAGELSGHYYFWETFGADDAIFASLKVVEIVSKERKKISELVKDFTEYFYEDFRTPIDDQKKFSFIKKLGEELKKERYSLDGDCVDGVKVLFKNGWALFRASNTEPKISIAYESREREEYEWIKIFVQSIIKKISKGK